MDMKKILQAYDSASESQPVEGSNDMKKFLSIVTESKPSNNRLTQAEQIAVQTYTKQPQKVVSTEKRGLFKEFYEKYESALNEELAENPVEEYTLQDIVNMVREGMSDEDIVAALGVNLQEGKVKGVDGKSCWKGKRYAGKEKKADGTYKDICVPIKSKK